MSKTTKNYTSKKKNVVADKKPQGKSQSGTAKSRENRKRE